MSSCVPPTMRRAFPRISASATAGWKVGRCCRSRPSYGQIASVDGAQLVTDSTGAVSARVQFPADEHSRRMAFHFKNRGASRHEQLLETLGEGNWQAFTRSFFLLDFATPLQVLWITAGESLPAYSAGWRRVLLQYVRGDDRHAWARAEA